MGLPPCTQPAPSYPNGTTGVAYDYTPPHDGDCSVSIAAFSVPPGLTLEVDGSGRLHGTPTTPGVYTGNICCNTTGGYPCTGKAANCSNYPVSPFDFTVTIDAGTPAPSWQGRTVSSFFTPPVVSGPGGAGATVLLHVCNATGCTSVTFNGNAATFTVINDCTIKAIVPSDPIGLVCVTTPSGTTCAALNIIATEPADPQVTQVLS